MLDVPPPPRLRQTPGGMNEQVIADLTAAGNYDNLKGTLDKLLPRLLG